MRFPAASLILVSLLMAFTDSATAIAQSKATKPETHDEDLQFVVYLSRHGVRSPTAKPEQYSKYAAAPWPVWDVPPGYLTAHGYQLMKIIGAYDRLKMADEGLLASSGCKGAEHVTILADSDQRTRETGNALAEGLLPGCSLEVHAQAEGTADPLFHSLEASSSSIDHQLAIAAIAGRIGGDPNALTEAYRPQLADLDQVLAGCGQGPAQNKTRTSLFDIPSDLSPGTGDHPAKLTGPLSTASTLSEILLLEYTEGFSAAKVGWGCADGVKIRALMQLHTGAGDFAQRTPAIARMYASNLLTHIVKALEQSATGKIVTDAPGKAGDRVLFLVGHDTNITTVAGALGLTWIIDGRRDDTPPGGVLVFALWRSRRDGKLSVRVSYTAQTLEQMRETQPLSLDHPPAEFPVFVPGCSGADSSCAWSDFQSMIQRTVVAPATR